MAVLAKVTLFLFIDLFHSCRMIMAVRYDATVLSELCRPARADLGDPCEFSKLGHDFDRLHFIAMNDRGNVATSKLTDQTSKRVTCYLAALCHKDVPDCDGCLTTARKHLEGCTRFVGGQANLKDCEIKYDKYGQFEH